jgi:hypothetical protein
MGKGNEESHVLVSIQDVAAKNSSDGHLAWGCLISQDHVLVPGPASWWKEGITIEVLVFSDAPSLSGAERLGVERVERRGVKDRPDIELSDVVLESRSQHLATELPVGEIFLRSRTQEEKAHLALNLLVERTLRGDLSGHERWPPPSGTRRPFPRGTPFDDRRVDDSWLADDHPLTIDETDTALTTAIESLPSTGARSLLCVVLGFKGCS